LWRWAPPTRVIAEVSTANTSDRGGKHRQHE
jgi:hypothetical protein